MAHPLVTSLIKDTEQLLSILTDKIDYLSRMKIQQIPELITQEEVLIERIAKQKVDILQSGIRLSVSEKEKCSFLQKQILSATNIGTKKLQAVFSVHNNIIGFIKDEIEKTVKTDSNYNYNGKQQLGESYIMPAVTLNQTA
jgi:hypothetical protein